MLIKIVWLSYGEQVKTFRVMKTAITTIESNGTILILRGQKVLQRKMICTHVSLGFDKRLIISLNPFCSGAAAGI